MSQKDKTTSTENLPNPAAIPRRYPFLRRIARLYAWIRGCLALGMLLLCILLFTPITEKIYFWLDVTEPPTHADYIICLGGNTCRLVWAVHAYREGYAPRIIVTNTPSASNWMKNKLIECGIPPEHILVDSTSKTTGHHPPGIAALDGIDPETQKFLIVTDFEHSRRAAACFRKAGYRHISLYGAGFKLKAGEPYGHMCKWRFRSLTTILYECAGLGKYWLQGKI